MVVSSTSRPPGFNPVIDKAEKPRFLVNSKALKYFSRLESSSTMTHGGLGTRRLALHS
jgi:hypothetical protein